MACRANMKLIGTRGWRIGSIALTAFLWAAAFVSIILSPEQIKLFGTLLLVGLVVLLGALVVPRRASAGAKVGEHTLGFRVIVSRPAATGKRLFASPKSLAGYQARQFNIVHTLTDGDAGSAVALPPPGYRAVFRASMADP